MISIWLINFGIFNANVVVGCVKNASDHMYTNTQARLRILHYTLNSSTLNHHITFMIEAKAFLCDDSCGIDWKLLLSS